MSLSYFVIFNPTLRSDISNPDKDLQDDLRDAAQILFYTSREPGGVSRDKMLRQVGLAKGLMSFVDMVAGGDGWYGVHSQKSRMIIYSLEKDYYLYINVTGQCGPDNMLVDLLKRGYEDYLLLYPSLAIPADDFWTRFALTFESQLGPNLTIWLGGFPTSLRDPSNSQPEIGVVDLLGPQDITIEPALQRYLHALLVASISIPETPQPEPKRNWAYNTVSWVPGISRKENDEDKWRLGGLGHVLGLKSRTPSRAGPPEEIAKESEVEHEPEWQSRTIYMKGEQQSLSWVIRNEMLYYVLGEHSTLPDVAQLRGKPRVKENAPAPFVHHKENDMTTCGELDGGALSGLADLKDVLDQEIHEIFARTPSSRYILGKRSADQELYMLVGRKDASLTDADRECQREWARCA